MATTDTTTQRLLIGGEGTTHAPGRPTAAFPFTGEHVVGGGGRRARGCPRGRRRGPRAFGEWSRSAAGRAPEILTEGGGPDDGAPNEIAGIVTEETGGVFGWGMFNVQLAAGMLREAAAQAYGLVGEVIPSDVPGKLAMGVRRPPGWSSRSRRGTRP